MTSENSSVNGNSGGSHAAAVFEDDGQFARHRAAILDLLAMCFVKEPGEDLIQAFRETEFRKTLEDAGLELGNEFFTEEIQTLQEKLAVEFTNLFLLPGSLISPHESVQIKGGSGLLRGPEAASVGEYYEYVGFELKKDLYLEPDHIGIELEFLSHLASIEYKAREENNYQQLLDSLRFQEDFLNRHLCRWVFDFMNKIQERTSTIFYREVARMTAAFLDDLQNLLPQLISRIDNEKGLS